MLDLESTTHRRVAVALVLFVVIILTSRSVMGPLLFAISFACDNQIHPTVKGAYYAVFKFIYGDQYFYGNNSASNSTVSTMMKGLIASIPAILTDAFMKTTNGHDQGSTLKIRPTSLGYLAAALCALGCVSNLISLNLMDVKDNRILDVAEIESYQKSSDKYFPILLLYLSILLRHWIKKKEA